MIFAQCFADAEFGILNTMVPLEVIAQNYSFSNLMLQFWMIIVIFLKTLSSIVSQIVFDNTVYWIQLLYYSAHLQDRLGIKNVQNRPRFF